MNGQIFVNPTSGTRIVGPGDSPDKLAATLNDPQLHIAFSSDRTVDGAARIYTRRMMAGIADYPVIVLPEELRDRWEADQETRPRHIEEHTDALPDEGTAKTRVDYDVVTPRSST